MLICPWYEAVSVFNWSLLREKWENNVDFISLNWSITENKTVLLDFLLFLLFVAAHLSAQRDDELILTENHWMKP